MIARRFVGMLVLAAILSVLTFGQLSGASAGQSNVSITSLRLGSSSAAAGGSVTAQIVVRNSGRGATSPVLTVWLVPPGQTLASVSRSALLSTNSLGTLAAGKQITVVATLPIYSGTPAGTYQTIAQVDTGKAETMMSDNTAAATLTVFSSTVASTTPTTDSTTSSSTSSASSTSSTSSGSSTTSTSTTTPTSTSTSTTTPTSTSTSGSTSTSTSGSSTSTATASTSCDYYASPTGRGDGRTVSTPFSISSFWSVASAGKTLCLLDGIYQGTSSMIAPGSASPGLSGTSSNPITIRALNDGGATIDAQFATYPVYLNGNNWWVLEGFNAKNGSDSVVFVYDSSNNVARRIVAWDTRMDMNSNIFGVHGASNGNTFEDCAGFGTARKILSPSQGPTNTTFRRCWARWEGSINVGPKFPVQLYYNTTGFKCENCIATWSAESMPQSYTLYNNGAVWTGVYAGTYSNYEVQSPDALFSMASDNYGADLGIRVYGSLAYLKGVEDRFTFGTLFRSIWSSGVYFRHNVAVVHPNHPRFSSTRGFLTTTGVTLSNVIADRNSSVRGTADVFSAGFVVTGQSEGTQLAKFGGTVADPWTSTTVGANLCNRWIDGAPSQQPLWPWPMTQRIKSATASAGAYAGPCPGCSGGRAARTATDVTAEVEALLGTIPSQCKSQ